MPKCPKDKFADNMIVKIHGYICYGGDGRPK